MIRPAKYSRGFELEEEPLRSELYSITQMDQYGKYLGRTHVLSDMHEKDRLLARLADNETVIRRVYDILASAVRSENRITPAAEWLLDNFYLIEEQIQIAKNHLPEKYSSELPRLSNGTMGSVPRVYELALEVVSHGDGHIEANSLSHFISSYQSESVLTLGELWAIPIMLRLALIENLRRVAVRLAISRAHHELAEEWVQKFTDTAENDPGQPDPSGRRSGPFRPANGQCLRCRADTSPAKPESDSCTSVDVDFATSFGNRDDYRTTGHDRNPAAGSRSGQHQQQYRKHPAARCNGLARICRIPLGRRTDFAHGPDGSLSTYGFCFPGSLPAPDRKKWPKEVP